MINRTLYAILLLPCIITYSGAAVTDDLQYFKKLAQPESPAREVGAFTLDEDIFEHTSQDYSNFRVFSKEGIETPMLIRTRKERKRVTEEIEVGMLKDGLEMMPGNTIQIFFKNNDHKQGPFPSALNIQTAEKNFEKIVSVYGSLDNDYWLPLAENQPIFDYSRFIDIRNTRVELKYNRSLFFKIVISNITEAEESPLTQLSIRSRNGTAYSEEERKSLVRNDFRIEKVRFIAETAADIALRNTEKLYPIDNMEVAEDQEERQTIITFNTRRQPLTSFTILTTAKNFHRPVTVQAAVTGKDNPTWTTAVSGSISRISLSKTRIDKRKLYLSSPCRETGYKIIISNSDSPPIDIQGIEARGEIHEALFLADHTNTYSVYYGGDLDVLPRYDMQEILRGTPWPETDIYTAGVQEENEGYDPERSRRGLVLSNRYLTLAIMLMVAVLIWLLIKGIKKAEDMPL